MIFYNCNSQYIINFAGFLDCKNEHYTNNEKSIFTMLK